MIPPDGVKKKLDGVIDIVSHEKSCEVLAGELTHEYWNRNSSEYFADSDDGNILLKLGGGIIIKCYEE